MRNFRSRLLARGAWRVIDIVERRGIVVLEGLAAWCDSRPAEWQALHAVSDGTFIVDGQRLDRREARRTKPPKEV